MCICICLEHISCSFIVNVFVLSYTPQQYHLHFGDSLNVVFSHLWSKHLHINNPFERRKKRKSHVSAV